MAVWWRSSHERPYSDRATWRWSAGDAWWWSNDWHEDNPEGWRNEQGTDPPGEWTASEWRGDEYDGPPAETPPSPEAETHELDQYPWARQQPQDDSCESGGPERETTASLDATHDPLSKDGAGGPSSPAPRSAVLQSTARKEKRALEKLHAEALRRFRLAQHSSESDDDDGEKQDVVAPSDIEDPIDPGIGTYDPKTGGVHCVICDTPLNSKGQFHDHLKGKKHWKNYDRYLKRKEQEEAEASQAALATSFQ